MKRKKAPKYMVRDTITRAGLILGAAFALSAAATAQETDDSTLGEDQAVMEEVFVEEEPYVEEYVDTTVEEIENLISLPPQARLGREADEDLSQPSNVFATPGAIESLLEPRPRFVYFPEGIDPMIIPWVREQIVIQEKMEDARRAFDTAQKQRDRQQATRALDIVNELQQKYQEAANNKDVGGLKLNIEKLIAQLDNKDTEIPPEINDDRQELPRWIVSNTRGVVLDRDNPRESYVLLGDFILQEGDHVETFPAVIVKEILPQKVVYEFENREHVVAVQAL